MILYTELFSGRADIFLPAGSIISFVWSGTESGQELMRRQVLP